MADVKDAEKAGHIDEHAVKPGDSDTSLSPVEDDPRVKRIIRKVDYRLSAILAVSWRIDIASLLFADPKSSIS